MIRFLRAAILYARSFPYVPVEPEWTEDDAAVAQNFFSHGAGAKLLLRLKNYSANLAIERCQVGTRHDIANGAAMQIAAIESHFPTSQSESVKTETEEVQAHSSPLEFERLNLA